jgi:hypothetical protein
MSIVPLRELLANGAKIRISNFMINNDVNMKIESAFKRNRGEARNFPISKQPSSTICLVFFSWGMLNSCSKVLGKNTLASSVEKA